MFVPSGAKATWAREWAVDADARVHLSRASFGASTKFTDRHDPISESGAVSIGLAATDEEGSTLYAPDGSRRRSSRSRRTRRSAASTCRRTVPGSCIR
jgi:hypothetical protein